MKEERYYFGDYEIYRKFVSGTLDTERTTVNISDDKAKIATVDTQTVENSSLTLNPTAVVRYQYDNHLGSASLELDDLAEIISYEEYHPFGTTSYRSGRTETETSQKRYKYVGKERDEETGLYYYGARYYAAWICRFVSVDPLQFDYPYYTPYQYAGNKPISYIDLDGLEEAKNDELLQPESVKVDNTYVEPPWANFSTEENPILYNDSTDTNSKTVIGTDMKLGEKGEKLLENSYYHKGIAYLPFTDSKSENSYVQGDSISLADRKNTYGRKNRPTWCNMLARDLSIEVLGENPFGGGDKSADDMLKYMEDHPESFKPLDSTFKDVWNKEINKHQLVFFATPGHIAVGVPTKNLISRDYVADKKKPKEKTTYTFGNVVQAGKNHGKMSLNYAWGKSSFKNIKMFKYVPKK
ncbi:MAG: hypothetical protein GQ564_12905 [Bacteroidales bacterium]|nr:hypothetical protein [Bacteroidales bacterium]